MKKMILAMCILSLTATANAACNGGTERSGFCVSNVTMNWWSASALCQANGRHLATMYEACPNWDGNAGDSKCPALGGGGWAWTATANGNNYTFVVYLNSGSVNDSHGNRDKNIIVALCK